MDVLAQLQAQIAAVVAEAFNQGSLAGHAQGLADAAAPLLALEASLHQTVSDAQAAVQALIDGGGEASVVLPVA